uniref:Uncharacterized protein n=1 Tax=Anguilla anguilla TaxID=7936 RepID=A0A0E9RC78_ANGAN
MFLHSRGDIFSWVKLSKERRQTGNRVGYGLNEDSAPTSFLYFFTSMHLSGKYAQSP